MMVTGVCIVLCLPAVAESGAALSVHLARTLQPWGDHGVNDVEVRQTRDCTETPRDYGELSAPSEAGRREILDMVFGLEGLQAGLVTMFFSAWHKAEGGGRFHHEATARWIHRFPGEGLPRTRTRGGDLEIITALDAAPARATQQQLVRGRDLDAAQAENQARSVIDWVPYLRDERNSALG